MAFKIAASQALKKYAPQAQPVLMEPMMAVEVVTPKITWVMLWVT